MNSVRIRLLATLKFRGAPQAVVTADIRIKVARCGPKDSPEVFIVHPDWPPAWILNHQETLAFTGQSAQTTFQIPAAPAFPHSLR